MKDFEWCTGCKEYDHEKHCCPRFNKVIRTTLNDNINAVLGEIETEIKALTGRLEPEHIWNVDVLQIIDKYRAKSEDK